MDIKKKIDFFSSSFIFKTFPATFRDRSVSKRLWISETIHYRSVPNFSRLWTVWDVTVKKRWRKRFKYNAPKKVAFSGVVPSFRLFFAGKHIPQSRDLTQLSKWIIQHDDNKCNNLKCACTLKIIYIRIECKL